MASGGQVEGDRGRDRPREAGLMGYAERDCAHSRVIRTEEESRCRDCGLVFPAVGDGKEAIDNIRRILKETESGS